MKTLNFLLYFSSYATAKDSLRKKVNNAKQNVKASVESIIADVEKSVESAALKNIEDVESAVIERQKDVIDHQFQWLLQLSQNLRVEGECVLSRDMDSCTAVSDCTWCNCDVVYTEFDACAPQRVAQELESVCMCDSSEAFEGTEEPTSEETSEATDDEKSEVLEGTEEPTSEETSEATDDETSLVSSSNITKVFAEEDESVGIWHEVIKCAIKSLQNCAQSECSICECDILGNDVPFCVEAGFAVEVAEVCDCSDAVRIKHLLTKNLNSLLQN